MAAKTRSVPALCLLFGLLCPPLTAVAASGGPDAFGYVWADSDTPGVDRSLPPLSTSHLTTLSQDLVAGPIALPFSFPFYGGSYTQLYVSDNGWLSFVWPSSSVPAASPMPDPAEPNAAIAFYWKALTPSATLIHGPGNSTIPSYVLRFQERDTASNAVVTVNVGLWASGTIKIDYATIPAPTDMVVGIENAAGTVATCLCHSGQPRDGFAPRSLYAVQFRPPSPLSCPGAPITCGSPVHSNGPAGADQVSYYSCSADAFTGAEEVYSLTLTQPQMVTATLSGFGARRLGLFLLQPCHPESCVRMALDTFRLPNVQAGQYTLVVDPSTAGDAGAYDLAVVCAPPEPPPSITGWEWHEGAGPVVGVGPYASRGDPDEYRFAIVPPIGDPGWRPANDVLRVGLDRASTLCAYECGEALEFTYFRTCIYIPIDATDFRISTGIIDDGVEIRINGAVIDHGFLGGYNSTNLLANPAVATGRLNDVLIVHVDDCCADSRFNDVSLLLDGVDLTDIEPKGCSVTAATTFSAIRVCRGQDLLLDGTPSLDGSCAGVLEFRWREGAAVIRDYSPDPTAHVSPMASAVYTLDVRCEDGCGCGKSTDVAVDVSPGATVSAGPDHKICQGQSAALGGSPTAAGGAPPYTYRWTPATGLDDPASPNPTATCSTSTFYSVEVVDGAGCSSFDSAAVEVVSNGVPGTMGNTMRMIKLGIDIGSSWKSDLYATSYSLKQSDARAFAPSQEAVRVGSSSATLRGAVTSLPPLRYYRVNGISCSGMEGP